MLRVPVNQARESMRLAAPVLHPHHPETLLLRQGFLLDTATIERLKELRIESVWVEYPELEFIGRYISPRVMRERGIVASVVGEVLETISQRASAKLDYAQYRATIRDFVNTIYDHPSAALLVEHMHTGDRPLMRHCADVCYLTLLMGMKLETYIVLQRHRLPGYRARDIVDLGMAALLHDVGMLALEPGVLDKWVEEGCPEDDAAWRRHVMLGYHRLRGGIGPAASAAILHHHQHWDGSGFPLKRAVSGGYEAQRGEEIHVFARVLMVADLFDRLCNPPGRAERVPTVRVLRWMQCEPYTSWMDPVVFRALMAVAPPYAPGKMVTLSNGDVGVVVEWSPSDPCRPVVQLLGEVQYARPKRHDLRLNRSLTVVEVDGEDVSTDNFYPEHPGAFDLVVVAPVEGVGA